MTYEVIHSGEPLTKAKGVKVYLGGSCKRSGKDWRMDFYKRFENYNMTFINPRRDDFPDPDIDPGEHSRQVQWEREGLALCDVAIFWLGGGLSNQASRVEIGFVIGKNKEVYIGAEDGFLGMEHLTAFSGLLLSQSLDGVMARLQSYYVSQQS